ncbi:hypothetical protein ACFWIA_33020 [Streptomyces sp. NPDC127068]|uniref:hypothetical protein n=1 Tax=Streptomyces sp. NPDC127068 TaxID=3347127 RepID=UPI00364D582C
MVADHSRGRRGADDGDVDPVAVVLVFVTVVIGLGGTGRAAGTGVSSDGSSVIVKSTLNFAASLPAE